jgi:phosphate transport system substrate-binding protein
MRVVSILRTLIVPVVFAVFSLSAMYAQAAEHPNALLVTGSTTVEKALLLPNLARIRAATGLEIELQCKGTGPGLLKLAAGFADVSGASETLQDAIASATKRATSDRDPTVIPSNLVYTEILHERIVVIVNAKNTGFQKLDKQQLAEIFTQKTVNWKRVGGNDEYITVFISPVGAATRALFQKVIMDGAEFPNDQVHKGGIVMPVSTTARLIDNVAMVPDSIAAVSESVLNSHPRKSDVRVVETPVIDHPLGLITVGKPSAKVQKLIDYLRSAEGKIK